MPQSLDCGVGSVEVDEKTNRPRFGNKIVCPGCGERSLDDAYLNGLEQSQLTAATFDCYDDVSGFDDDDLFGDMLALCNGCDCFLTVNDLGLCCECAAKLDRDLIRQRDWKFSAAVYGVDTARQAELRKTVITKYVEKNELILPPGAGKKPRKKPGKKRKKGIHLLELADGVFPYGCADDEENPFKGNCFLLVILPILRNIMNARKEWTHRKSIYR